MHRFVHTGPYRPTNTRIGCPTLNTPEVLVTSAAQGYHSYPDSFGRVARLRPVPRAGGENLVSRAKVLLPPDHPQRREVVRQLAEAYQGVSAATENASTWPSCPSPDGLWSTWRRNGDALRAKATAAWLEANPRFHPHHTPAHASWLNQVELVVLHSESLAP